MKSNVEVTREIYIFQNQIFSYLMFYFKKRGF